MIFPLHFSSRDSDLVIMSEDNRHYGRQSWQLTGLTLEIKANKTYFIFPPLPYLNITGNKSAVPEWTPRNCQVQCSIFSAGSSHGNIFSWSKRNYRLIFFPPWLPASPPLCITSEKVLVSNLWGTENCHWATQQCSVCCIWKVCPSSPLSLGCLIYDTKQEKIGKREFQEWKSLVQMLAQSCLQFWCLKNTACSFVFPSLIWLQFSKECGYNP